MLPPVDIAYIQDELRAQSEDILEAFEDQNGAEDSDPQILLAALDELFDDMRRLESGNPRDRLAETGTASRTEDLGALGDNGLHLLDRLGLAAGRLHLPQRALAIEGLALPLACWVARRGGEVTHLAPIVNGAAGLANGLRKPVDLGQLYGLLTEVMSAVSPQVSQDTGSCDPTRPWRVLLLNRAIVATRSHQIAFMEDAFESIIEHLPEEAPTFFREGMEQMEALKYPPQVRALMQHYHDRWRDPRVLH
jgi:hypothetical protein